MPDEMNAFGNPEVESILEEGLEVPTSHLRREYEELDRLFQVQPTMIQRFLESQAKNISEAIIQNLPQLRFTLPDRIVCEVPAVGHGRLSVVPSNAREQMAGGLMDRLTRTSLRIAVRQRLSELEQSSTRSISVSARLLRHTTAMFMVHSTLPAGRSVVYKAAEGEEIPTIPIENISEPGSAITAASDAIVEEGGGEGDRGELIVPYVPYARRFFLPQWVSFDEKNNLLVSSVNEAEANLASMQRYVDILHAAVGLAPYMVADPVYQKKRYGILGQLVNQGRALAFYQTGEIIRTINRRAAAKDLNRGLSLSLPYFDDQDLQMKTHDFTVIPAGRIMFIPAFVVRAAREEEVKIAQHTRLSHSTRKYLLAQLKLLEKSFDTASSSA